MKNVRRVVLAALAVMTAATGVLVIVSEPLNGSETAARTPDDPTTRNFSNGTPLFL